MKKITDFQAVLWDFDGVIVDSEKLWGEYALDFYLQICPSFDRNDMQKFVGGSLKNAWQTFRDKYQVPISYLNFKTQCEDFALENMYPKTKLSPFILDCFEILKKEKIPQIIASSGTKRWILPTIERLKIADFFAGVVASEDTKDRGKPFPDVFLLASQKVQQNPANCLIIEDSHNGVKAGKIAGSTVYAYQNGYNNHQDLSQADLLFSDFREII